MAKKIMRGRASIAPADRKAITSEARAEIRQGTYRQVVVSSAIEGKYASRSEPQSARHGHH